jgi:predicted AAA+ superfamily ATPase
MKIIERKNCLNRLIRLKDTPDIKIITGLRRSGKSELVRAYMEWMCTNEDANIIYVDFADLKFDDLKTYKELYTFLRRTIH